jgi:hypothetical protein
MSSSEYPSHESFQLSLCSCASLHKIDDRAGFEFRYINHADFLCAPHSSTFCSYSLKMRPGNPNLAINSVWGVLNF